MSFILKFHFVVSLVVMLFYHLPSTESVKICDRICGSKYRNPVNGVATYRHEDCQCKVDFTCKTELHANGTEASFLNEFGDTVTFLVCKYSPVKDRLPKWI